MANDSTYWLIFELLWRDFFRYSAVKNGNSIFHLGGPRHDAGRQRWLDDTGSLEAWKEGETGYPFIDANMRELKASGFMSNRYARLSLLLSRIKACFLNSSSRQSFSAVGSQNRNPNRLA